MSGIAGIYSLKRCRNDRQKINILLDKIPHRGARREIFSIPGGYAGINTNYSFKARIGKNAVLMDGRIYNLDYLLKKYGIEVKNTLISDSGKICLLIDKAGREVFSDFKGSFALAIVDKEGNIYLARDFLGTKPLYYYKDDSTLVFASEVKSLTGYGSDVKEFPPGSYMMNLSKPEVTKKIDMERYPIFLDKDTGVMEDKLDGYLLKSMDTRITDGNPVLGVWLSGGLDSSLVAALLKEFTDKVYTYSVGYEGSPDLEAAKEVSNFLGTRHTEYKLNTEELFSTIPKAIYHLESFDAPLVRSTLGNMIVSKISAFSDVIFSGEGGDELFAGYNYFLEYDSFKVIQEGIVDAINSLHNTALQRVDRSANAYGVNVKFPMLDEDLLNYVLKITPGKKVRKDKKTGKYILRKVASKYLPDDIAWRDKDKFWEGAGIVDKLEKKIENMVTDKEFLDISNDVRYSSIPVLRNKEEAYYYRVFKNYYPDVKIENILSFTEDFN
ncbi:MAG: asparagine synthase [Actinobacteria bacterium]|nr:asparagine synthase [Actinomycetota bacterium]